MAAVVTTMMEQPMQRTIFSILYPAMLLTSRMELTTGCVEQLNEPSIPRHSGPLHSTLNDDEGTTDLPEDVAMVEVVEDAERVEATVRVDVEKVVEVEVGVEDAGDEVVAEEVLVTATVALGETIISHRNNRPLRQALRFRWGKSNCGMVLGMSVNGVLNARKFHDQPLFDYNGLKIQFHW
jgi:hypothetical protein